MSCPGDRHRRVTETTCLNTDRGVRTGRCLDCGARLSYPASEYPDADRKPVAQPPASVYGGAVTYS